VLAGLGSFAAGSAAVMGSGAFAVEARDREGTGTISNDNTAYLSLKPNTGEGYSRIRNDGELEVTLDSLNTDSVTELDDLFFVQNGGTNKVVVRITNISTPNDVSVNRVFASSDADGNTNGNSTGDDMYGTNSPGANLAVGEQIGVGAEIDLADIPAGQSADFSFTVDADSA